MAKPKQITGKFNFTVQRNLTNTTLYLDDYNVGSYPLTYSIMDCLEHFCDWAGWELYSFRYHYEGINATDGSTVMKRPFGECSFASTFIKARTLYRGGLEVTLW